MMRGAQYSPPIIGLTLRSRQPPPDNYGTCMQCFDSDRMSRGAGRSADLEKARKSDATRSSVK